MTYWRIRRCPETISKSYLFFSRHFCESDLSKPTKNHKRDTCKRRLGDKDVPSWRHINKPLSFISTIII